VLPYIAVGNRCIVISKAKGERAGLIKYIGEVDFKPSATMIGVELDESLGKHDGSVDGKRYFQCPNGHGIFVEPKLIKPEIPHDDVANSNGQQQEEIEEI